MSKKIPNRQFKKHYELLLDPKNANALDLLNLNLKHKHPNLIFNNFVLSKDLRIFYGLYFGILQGNGKLTPKVAKIIHNDLNNVNILVNDNFLWIHNERDSNLADMVFYSNKTDKDRWHCFMDIEKLKPLDKY